MKIALCVSSLPLCGIGTSIGIIRAGLSNAGHTVDVLVTSDRPGGDFERARRDGWSIECCGKGARFLRARLRMALERLNRYDVVINNHSVETQLVTPCLPSNVIRISVMRAITDSALEQLSLNSRYFDAAVAISREMERAMQGTPSIECPIHLIPNCTDATSDGLPDLDSPVRIAYVGWLRQRDKNALVLPEIVASLHGRGVDFLLTIVGDGPDRQALKRAMAKVPAQGKVTMVGQIPRSKAREVLRESHFALIPSHYEGLSNVMLEAMALGSVPITSELENFQWVLGDVASKLQGPVNFADGYAERLANLAADPTEYRRIQVYLRHRQRTLFTPETTINGYLALIARLKTDRDRKSFQTIPFDRLVLPGRYRQQCTIWWRCLQMARDCLGARTG